MTHPTGDEPSLSGQSEFSGREPALGGSMGSGMTAALDGLTDRDWQVRVRSVRYLGEHQIGAAADRVVALLRDPNGQVRDAALRASVKIGEPAVLPLIEMLRVEQERKVRRTIMRALQDIQQPAVPLLLDLLRSGSESVGMQIKFITILSGIQHENVVSAMIPLLAHEDQAVQFAAVGALRRQRETALPALIQALQHPHSGIRGWAAGMLGQREHRPAIPVLIEAAHDLVMEVRHAAIYALARMDHDAPLDVILGALHDPTIETRQVVVRALSYVHRPETAVVLFEIAKQGESVEVRQEALGVLHGFAAYQEQILSLLVEIARNAKDDLMMRVFAVEVLAELSAVDPLLLLVQDSALPDIVRDIAADRMIYMDTPEALAAVERYRSGLSE